jgi:hypothetical protein
MGLPRTGSPYPKLRIELWFPVSDRNLCCAASASGATDGMATGQARGILSTSTVAEDPSVILPATADNTLALLGAGG